MQAGPFRKAPLAMATGLIAANLPDVDGVIYFYGNTADALAFRRGWTHGILAMAVLPFVLAGAMLAFDRFVRRRIRPEKPPALWRPLLLLSAIGVLSHPLLDFLNTYGVRFLAPFSWEWFYGDALYIIDPSGSGPRSGPECACRAGVRRRASPTRNAPRAHRAPATAAYAVSMMLSGVVGRLAANRSFAGSERRMVGPKSINPLRRQLVLDFGQEYRYGSVEFRPWPNTELSRNVDPKDTDDPLAQAAAATDRGRKFGVVALSLLLCGARGERRRPCRVA